MQALCMVTIVHNQVIIRSTSTFNNAQDKIHLVNSGEVFNTSYDLTDFHVQTLRN